MAEKRLERLRQVAATVPGKEALMKQASRRTRIAREGNAQGGDRRAGAGPAAGTDAPAGASNGIDIRGVEDDAHQGSSAAITARLR